MVMNAKTGGKNGKHAAIVEASNVAAVSYIGLQVFEQTHIDNLFTPTTETNIRFGTKRLVLLPSLAFLCLLQSSPVSMGVKMSGDLSDEISAEDLHTYQELASCTNLLTKVMNSSRRRGV